MFNAHDIPEDVVLCIAELLQKSSLLALRLVCRHFCGILTPSALHTVYIKLDANAPPPGHSPTSDFHPISDIYDHAKLLHIEIRGLVVPTEIPPNIPELVSNLRSLTGFSWTEMVLRSNEAAPDWQEHIISSVLTATGGKLNSLVVELGVTGIPNTITQFRSLKNLSYTNHSRQLHPTACVHVQTLISHNLSLESLHFSTFSEYTLNDIIQPPIRLAPRMIDLNHFRPSNEYPQFSFVNLRKVYLRPRSSHQGLDPFWDTLRRENIYLEEIRTSIVSPSLLHYLSSFVGLRSFSRTMSDAIFSVDHGTGTSLFDTALPKHGTTLKSLSLKLSDFPSYSAHHSPFSHFVALETFRVYLPKTIVLTEANLQEILNNIQGLRLDYLYVNCVSVRTINGTFPGWQSKTGYPKWISVVVLGTRLELLLFKCCKLAGEEGWVYRNDLEIHDVQGK